MLDTFVSYSGGGFTHVLRPTSGNDWGDTVTSCANLSYAVYVSP